jgi:catechol 2,3-dioxygenase-like lactoylglutathione lyase family enzyme
MNIIPIIQCGDIKRSISFYTEILDFEALNPDSPFGYIVLMRNKARLDLSIHSGDGVFGSKVLIIVDDVDQLYKKLIARGLDLSGKKDSPVHQSPVDQTWGMREFYADDPDGNTVRFAQPIA